MTKAAAFIAGVIFGAVGLAWLAVPASAQKAPWTSTPSAGISTIDAGCAVATLMANADVLIDWHCAEKYAAQPANDTTSAFARILIAVRDGKAKSK